MATNTSFGQLNFRLRTAENCGYHLGRRKDFKNRSQRFRCGARNQRRTLIKSDGEEHIGSTLEISSDGKPFPGPPGKKGPPLRILPIGGLGEIGMNCMLVGVYTRFVLVDAGLMFPDFTDVGMQKILPDTSFLHQWKDRIEAVIITHGHEDHIGAIPWVLPALDPSTPIYSSPFVHQLLRNRLMQFNLWDASRFHCFEMNKPFSVGPFECEALRVTHSIPDCCGLFFRSDHGTILHTGDWKIDEEPVDGRLFDRETFERISKENVTLMMSDSTNVLTPGRSVSESVVRRALIDRITNYKGSGRILATLFASNLHRVGSLKMAADESGRKICCVGLSLLTYLEAASKSGDAPFDPTEMINIEDLEEYDPKELLVLTTGSQAETRAQLPLAANDASSNLRLDSDDLVLYSAKVIPGNEKRVMKMMNQISRIGCEVIMDRTANLHASGHGYKEELSELIKLVKPQHFLPIHGESVFLYAHAELAKDLGIQRTSVIHDGEMLGVKPTRSRRTVSSGSMQVLGDVDLTRYYNDGNVGTGTYDEMCIPQRAKLGTDGVIVVAVNLVRPPRLQDLLRKDAENLPSTGLKARVKVSFRGIWTNSGKLIKLVFQEVNSVIEKCAPASSLISIERKIATAVRKTCRKFNKIVPEVIVISHEYDPRIGATLYAISKRKDANNKQIDSYEKNGLQSKKSDTESLAVPDRTVNTEGKAKRRGRPPKKGKEPEGSLLTNKMVVLHKEFMEERKRKNPRENPVPGADLEYG